MVSRCIDVKWLNDASNIALSNGHDNLLICSHAKEGLTRLLSLLLNHSSDLFRGPWLTMPYRKC
jgi:hypothetical protein